MIYKSYAQAVGKVMKIRL